MEWCQPTAVQLHKYCGGRRLHAPPPNRPPLHRTQGHPAPHTLMAVCHMGVFGRVSSALATGPGPDPFRRGAAARILKLWTSPLMASLGHHGTCYVARAGMALAGRSACVVRAGSFFGPPSSSDQPPLPPWPRRRLRWPVFCLDATTQAILSQHPAAAAKQAVVDDAEFNDDFAEDAEVAAAGASPTVPLPPPSAPMPLLLLAAARTLPPSWHCPGMVVTRLTHVDCARASCVQDRGRAGGPSTPPRPRWPGSP